MNNRGSNRSKLCTYETAVKVLWLFESQIAVANRCEYQAQQQ